MHLTLFIPDLLPPAGIEAALAAEGPAPVLRRTFGRGELQCFPAIDAEAWLCQAFEVEPREDWPVAALTAAVDGMPAESDWWLRADPVHLQMQRNSTRVLAAPALTLNEEEAAVFAAALNAHFTEDGITVTPAHPHRWYIRQSTALEVTAPTLSAAAGQPLRGSPLTGTQASHWHRILTETQMVLHAHPLNTAREARGLPAVNSLLLWGGGRKPAVPGRHFSHVWSDDSLATALAVQSAATFADAPANAASWFAHKREAGSRHLVTLERAHHAARYGGPDAWIKAVTALEELWFAPLWAALDGQRLMELVIVAGGPEQCLRCTLRPSDKLKFWRRPQHWKQLTTAVT